MPLPPVKVSFEELLLVPNEEVGGTSNLLGSGWVVREWEASFVRGLRGVRESSLGGVRQDGDGSGSGSGNEIWILYERETPWRPHPSCENKKRLRSQKMVVVLCCPMCGGGVWEVKYAAWKVRERSGRAKLKLERLVSAS